MNNRIKLSVFFVVIVLVSLYFINTCKTPLEEERSVGYKDKNRSVVLDESVNNEEDTQKTKTIKTTI